MEGWFTDSEEINESALCCTPPAQHPISPATSTDTTPGSPVHLLCCFSIPDVDPKVKAAANKLACGMRERRRKRRRFLNNASPSVHYLKRKCNPSITGITSLSEVLEKMKKNTDSEEVLEIPKEKENIVTKFDKKDAEDKNEKSKATDSVSILDDGDDFMFLEIGI